jgi:ABC-2 type transport system ATP-binding protein
MQDILTTNMLGKKYGQYIAVDNINLQIKKNCIYGLVGKNGAGKSSLMRMFAGLASPTSGTIELMGEKISRKSDSLKKIGSLIETPALYPNLSGYENLKIKSLTYGIEEEKHITQILDIVGLDPSSKKNVRGYSLGMKQRLGIGMALVGRPDLLILDEPINGLDPKGIIDIRNMLISINEKYGITIIISSHILEELSKLATDFGIMSGGRLIMELSSQELHEQCQSKIEIICSDSILASTILKQHGYINHAVPNSKKIVMNDYLGETAKINALLVKSGVNVDSIFIRETSFEDFFMEVTRNEESD